MSVKLTNPTPRGSRTEITLAACIALSLGLAVTSLAQPDKIQGSPSHQPSDSIFTRLKKTSATGVALQTRALRLVSSSGTGPDIWLVSTAHIGRTDYYKSIQDLLDAQSLVLFEGVRPKADSKIVMPSKPGAAAATTKPFADKDKSTYRLFADALGLDFQLYDIDYSKPTFKNCDLSWDQVESLAAKDGAATKKQVTGIGQMLRADSPMAKLLGSYLASLKSDPGSVEALRLILIEALSRPGVIVTFLGEQTSDVIIRKRNERVVSELANDKTDRSIAIFFGAAHMPDMEKEIVKTYGYREAEDKWFTAMTADESKVTGTAGPMLLSEFRQMLKNKK